MKGRWESNIHLNVWFSFMYSQKRNCYFQSGIICNVLSPSSYTHISVRDLYISRIWLQGNMWTDLGNKSLTDTWMGKLELRPCNSQKRNTWMRFSLQCFVLTREFFLEHYNKNIKTWKEAFHTSLTWDAEKGEGDNSCNLALRSWTWPEFTAPHLL